MNEYITLFVYFDLCRTQIRTVRIIFCYVTFFVSFFSGPFLDAQGFNLQFHVIIEDKEGFTSPVFDDSNNDTHTAFMDGGFEHMVTVFMVDYNAFFPSSIQSQLYYFLVYNESGYIEHQEGEVIGGNFTCDITLIVEGEQYQQTRQSLLVQSGQSQTVQ